MPQGVARAIARTIFSYVGWSQDRPAASPLPPLSPSAADDDTVTGPSVGAGPRQPVDIEDGSAQSNVVAQHQISDPAQEGAQDHFSPSPTCSGEADATGQSIWHDIQERVARS